MIGLQQMTLSVGAAIRVARVNCRTSLEQRDGLCGAAVVAQFSELGDGVIEIAGAIEIASSVAAQVVAHRGHRPAAVSPVATVRNNRILECYCAGIRTVPGTTAVGNAASGGTASCGLVPAEGAVVECYRATLVVDAAPNAAAIAVRIITIEGAIVDG